VIEVCPLRSGIGKGGGVEEEWRRRRRRRRAI